MSLLDIPATCLVIALCALSWFYQWNYRIPPTTVGLSYALVVEQKQYWRIVSASFSHADLMHLAFNVASLSSCAALERVFGSIFYIQTSVMLMALSSVLTLGMYHLLIHRQGLVAYREQLGVGYSCVVFGLMTILALLQPQFSVSIFGAFKVPVSLMPFVSLIMTQIIVQRASFLGHLSGIIAGFFLSWQAMSWLTPYWFFALFVYAVVQLLISLQATTNIAIPCIRIHAASSGPTSIVEGGILRSSDTWLANQPPAGSDEYDIV